MTKHEHEERIVCICFPLADEPKDDCMIHGTNDNPPRCSKCGRFVTMDVRRRALQRALADIVRNC